MNGINENSMDFRAIEFVWITNSANNGSIPHEIENQKFLRNIPLNILKLYVNRKIPVQFLLLLEELRIPTHSKFPERRKITDNL